jgi:hypothetical protein
MDNLLVLVNSFSDIGLKVWIAYLWDLRWSCSTGSIGDMIRKFSIWHKVWEGALGVWDARHPGDRDSLWSSISAGKMRPAKVKRFLA